MQNAKVKTGNRTEGSQLAISRFCILHFDFLLLWDSVVTSLKTGLFWLPWPRQDLRASVVFSCLFSPRNREVGPGDSLWFGRKTDFVLPVLRLSYQQVERRLQEAEVQIGAETRQKALEFTLAGQPPL
jgi:hypothetical protein